MVSDNWNKDFSRVPCKGNRPSGTLTVAEVHLCRPRKIFRPRNTAAATLRRGRRGHRKHAQEPEPGSSIHKSSIIHEAGSRPDSPLKKPPCRPICLRAVAARGIRRRRNGRESPYGSKPACPLTNFSYFALLSPGQIGVVINFG